MSPNAFWKAPWITFDPEETAGKDLPATYGPVEVRKFLVSFTGHCLCLDYFGGPSVEQAAAGLSLHGEAPNATLESTIAGAIRRSPRQVAGKASNCTSCVRARDSPGCE